MINFSDGDGVPFFDDCKGVDVALVTGSSSKLFN
jgi:hypothetical protein